jgi:c-di-GMP-related signal transduction protein
MELFVARQPIFDRNLSVVAYEMLYRSGTTNSYDGADPRTATAKVLNAVFYSPHGQKLLGGRPAFVNFPEALLVDGIPFSLPPNTVVEVLETVVPNDEVKECCRKLKENNYSIALDDFVDTDEKHPLSEYAKYIKVDLQSTDRARCRQLVAKYGRKITMLAEKVETEEEFRWAADAGFSLFQGYFFARPDIKSVSETPGFKLNYLRILKHICAPVINFGELAGLIEREPGLCYKLLRVASSALYGRRNPPTTVENALLLLGEDQTRKWLSLIVSVDLASDRPMEVMVSALVRARFSELLSPLAGLPPPSAEYFMLGLFSRLDALFGRPLAELLKDVAMPPGIRAVLLDRMLRKTRLGMFWRMILAYEIGDWDHASDLMSSLKLDPEQVHSVYSESLLWADANSGANRH